MTLGGITDPGLIERSYEDLNKILKSNPDNYKVTETRDENGKFESFIVET